MHTLEAVPPRLNTGAPTVSLPPSFFASLPLITAVVAQALLPAAKVQDEIQETLLTGLRAAAVESGDQLNAAIEKLPAELKQSLVSRLNGQ